MKKLTISLCILGFALTAKAQVGVNTTTPQGIFHVDANGDNPTTGAPDATKQANDVVVEKETGNVGIGTNDPAVKLDIETGGISGAPVAGFKLADGNQKQGAMLISDANGVGTWTKFGDYVTTDVEFSSVINTMIPITVNTSSGWATSNTQMLTPSSITVTIPSGYTTNVVLLSFDVWGDVTWTPGNNTGGSLRFHINQTGSSSNFIASISMAAWAGTSTQANGVTRFSTPVAYAVTGLTQGTYTFTLYVNREHEGSSVGPVNVWGIQGRATVLVK